MADSCVHETLKFGIGNKTVFCVGCDKVWFPSRADAKCDHKAWTFKKHGRCCFKCGEFMVDFGD